MPTPILLLKTQSTPTDAYAEYFSERDYTPIFIPVLEHDFHAANLSSIKHLFDSGALGPDSSSSRRKYGGIIFTSQRAVEGFAKVVYEVDHETKTAASKDMILYTVGPATSRSLSALITPDHLAHATVYGGETGNGENLAQFILEHYNQRFASQSQAQAQAQAQSDSNDGSGQVKPPLLFLVGEQRRDIIPRTLTGQPQSPEDRRIGVDEVTVYGTRVREDFEDEFRGVFLTDHGAHQGQDQEQGKEKEGDIIWVVVFSPTGCEAMLRVLRQIEAKGTGKKVYVATIGPTTRDHLRMVFGFEPHVCAERPSSEGVGEGIRRFMDCQ